MAASLKKLEAMDGGSVRTVEPVNGVSAAAHSHTSVQYKELHAVPRGGWLDGPGRFWGRN